MRARSGRGRQRKPGERAWKAFIELQSEGLTRAIGVSNFQPQHLRRLISETGVTPAVNQVELHLRFQQTGLRREHEELGIVTEAWSPLAETFAVFDFHLSDSEVAEIDALDAGDRLGPDPDTFIRP